MASQGDENMMISGNEEANGSGTTVEIKIKTLDSHTYTLRVDKCVPVPALKEQIALVTGILSEQQRLICRGKVLNDDQLLSAYHVEDGHTLHLVVRQPVAPSSESSPDPATDSTSASGHRHGGRSPGILVGSFNISEQDGAFPDLSRVVSAVLGSFGIPSGGNAGEEIDLNVLPTERFSNTINGSRNSSTQQSGQGDSRIQSSPSRGASPHQSGESSESLQPPVIPDSISTLSLNLGRLRQEFNNLADEQGYSSQSSSIHDGQNSHAALDEQRGLPTPSALGDVMLTARQVLHEQASECLLQLSRQLRGQANVIDVSDRSRVQSNAVRSGLLFHNLGTMLLELGRTMMTVRMGNSPADSVVNAGPAVFLSSAGPNPIMVQPLPFQPGTSLGAFSSGTQQSAGLAAGSVGSGGLPRNIDIRIRTVGSFVPISSIRRDLNGSQNAEQGAPVSSDDGNMGQQGGNRGSGNSATREPQVRVVPLRTIFSSVPASGARATSAHASRSGMGILYPVLSRFQPSNSGNSGSTAPGAPQANDQHHANGTGSIPVPISVLEHQTHVIPEIEHGSSLFTEMSNGQGIPAEIQRGFDRLLQTMFNGENLPGGSNSQDVDINFVNAPNAESSPAAETGSAGATPSEEGVFLSNVLQHIMPLITENVRSNLTSSSSDVHTVPDGNGLDSAQAGVNVNGGTPSRPRDYPETSDHTNPKRQKMD